VVILPRFADRFRTGFRETANPAMLLDSIGPAGPGKGCFYPKRNGKDKEKMEND
jgi:hypothetical protein